MSTPLSFPTISDADFKTEPIDPVAWLNKRLEPVPSNKMETFLNQLHLSLNLFTQDLSDRNELLGAQYLNSIQALQRDVKAMANEANETLTRFRVLESEQKVLDESGFKGLDDITHAKDKIDYIKSALSRRSFRG